MTIEIPEKIKKELAQLSIKEGEELEAFVVTTILEKIITLKQKAFFEKHDQAVINEQEIESILAKVPFTDPKDLPEWDRQEDQLSFLEKKADKADLNAFGELLENVPMTKPEDLPEWDRIN